ncbi:2-keto-4-pentenoate hydratase [Pseudochelatococcus sp. B33]
MTSRLSQAAVDKAAEALLEARRSVRVIDGLPADARPRSLEDAYRIQDRLAEKLGRPVGGWFSGGTNPVIQRRLGLDGPYWARLFGDLIRPSPAEVSAGDFPPIVLECEFVFVLARDLPVRETPYTREEVADAAGAVHPAIELVAGHLKDWADQDIHSVIADNGTDGALFYGAGHLPDAFDLSTIAVTLFLNGNRVQTGSGQSVLGHPLNALTWLVNARVARGEGVKAGQFFSTGSATAMQPAGAGDLAVADFGPLGRVELRIT